MDRQDRSFCGEGTAWAREMLDKIDLGILDVLQKDGRITNQALAEQVSLSPSACLARVRRLEREGFILGYRATLAIERIVPTLIVFGEVTLRQHHPDDIAGFERAATQIDEIIEAYQVSGPYDFLIKVAVRDIAAWRDLADRIVGLDIGVEKIASMCS